MGFTISEIARALSAQAVGDDSIVVLAASEPARAGVDDLAVAMDARFADALVEGNSRAAILRSDADWRGYGLEAAILVDRPRLALAALTNLLKPEANLASGVHPTAVVDASAKIGAQVSIGPYVVIESGVRIGARSRIGAQCHVASGSEIGPDCILQTGVKVGSNVRIGARFAAHPGVVLGADGFSFVTEEKSSAEVVRERLTDAAGAQDAQSWTKIHSLGGVHIGDDVEIGANSNVDAGTIRATAIGDGTKADALVQVGHNVTIGRNCLLCAHVAVGGSAVLGDGVVLGGQVGVADNILVGDGVIAGGATKILSNVPARRAILGYPAMKMDAHVSMYKALRRLPKLLQDVATLKKLAKRSDKID